MRKFVFFVTVTSLVFLLVFGFGYSWSQSTKTQMSEKGNLALNDYAPPPSSLDALYPPQTKEPVYLFKMFELGTFFSGIIADLFENDPQNAKGNFETFMTKHSELSKLIPEWEREWEKEYPGGPLDELKKALDRGDKAKAIESIEKVGIECHECHISYMAKVQQKYHWGNFEEIKLKDPLTNVEVNFAQLKQDLNANFAGINLNVEQGQKDNAKKQLQDFNARFQALKNTCQSCHKKEEMKHYVDQEIISLIEDMELELNQSTHDPKAIASLSQKVGMESCFKCHLIHIPSAYAKLQWKRSSVAPDLAGSSDTSW
jgi:cytochrome c556